MLDPAAVAITVKTFDLDTVRIDARHLEVPSETELGFTLTIGGRQIAAVYTLGYEDADAARSLAVAAQFAPTFDGLTVVVPSDGADLKIPRPWVSGSGTRLLAGAPSRDDVEAVLALAFLAVCRERDAARVRVDRLLAAAEDALACSFAGEELRAERVLRKAIAESRGTVAPSKVAPTPIEASSLGVVADVLRLLRENPAARIAVACASGADCIDRFESILNALRIVHGNKASVWPGPLPGIRIAGQDDASVRFFVEGTPLVSFEPSVVIRDAAPKACPLGECDGSGRIETKPAIHGYDGPEQAESDPCDCSAVPDDGSDPIFDLMGKTIDATAARETIIDAAIRDRLSRSPAKWTTLDDVVGSALHAVDTNDESTVADVDAGLARAGAVLDGKCYYLPGITDALPPAALAPAKLTREQIIESAALDCVVAGPQQWGDIARAINAALRAATLDPCHPGEVDVVIEAKMERSANGPFGWHVYGLRTIEGKVA